MSKDLLSTAGSGTPLLVRLALIAQGEPWPAIVDPEGQDLA